MASLVLCPACRAPVAPDRRAALAGRLAAILTEAGAHADAERILAGPLDPAAASELAARIASLLEQQTPPGA